MLDELLSNARCKAQLAHDYLHLKERSEESCAAVELGGLVLVLEDVLGALEEMADALTPAVMDAHRMTEVSHGRQ